MCRNMQKKIHITTGYNLNQEAMANKEINRSLYECNFYFHLIISHQLLFCAQLGIPPFEEDDPELLYLQENSKEDESKDEMGSLLDNRCIRHLDPPPMEARRLQQVFKNCPA